MVYIYADDATLDANYQLKDAGAIATTAATTVGGNAAYIDLGSAKYFKGKLIADITACEVADNNELYTLQLQGSTTSAFSSVYVLAERKLGALEVTGNLVDTAPVGRHALHFDNVAHTSGTTDAAQPVRYIRLRTVVAGTVATGINYTAYVVPANGAQ